MAGKKKPKKIFCRMTGKREEAALHIVTYCKFYSQQPPKPSLGNDVCHTDCTVPRRFEVPELAKNDAN